jgi:hypothetical protein
MTAADRRLRDSRFQAADASDVVPASERIPKIHKLPINCVPTVSVGSSQATPKDLNISFINRSAKKSSRKTKSKTPPVPPAADWRTTDQDEIARRVQRAIDEKHTISNLHPEHPVFSTFAVKSPSGMTYQTEIRDLPGRAFSCTCPDFRRNGLGTCKHIEAPSSG